MEKDAFVQILRNNGVANCDGSNQEIISQIQQQCKSELESSQKKLNEARALVKTLEEEVTAAERQYEFYMSASAPIRQVPVEVLSGIFALACHWDAFHFYPHITFGRKVQNQHTTGSSIIRVCKHWHDVALQSPAMWSHPFVFHDLRDDERMGEGVKNRLKAASAKCRGRPIPHVYFQNLGHPRALQQLNESLPWDLITRFSLTRACRYYLWFDILQSLRNLTYLHINGAKVTGSDAYDEDTPRATVQLNKLRVLEVHDDGLVFLQPEQHSPFKSMLSRVTAPLLETFDLIVTIDDRTFECLRGGSQIVTEFLSRSPALRRIRVLICPPSWIQTGYSTTASRRFVLKFSGDKAFTDRVAANVTTDTSALGFTRWGTYHTSASPSIWLNGGIGTDHFFDRFMEGEDPCFGMAKESDRREDLDPEDVEIDFYEEEDLELLEIVMNNILRSREGVPDGERVAYFVV